MPTYCEPCKSLSCSNPEDSETYSLQSELAFTSGTLSAVASCPVGFTCAPGTFPHTFIYDDDDWTVVIPGPVRDTGGPIMIKGCISDIVRIVPPNATDAQIEAIVQEMFQAAAAQQAICDSEDEPGVTPDPPPPPAGAFAMTTFSPTMVCLSTAFSASVTVNADSGTFSIIGSLPAGLALSQSGRTGTISGTPTTAGTTVFVIKAVSGSNEAFQQVTFAVVGITTASPLTNASEGIAYSETIAATGLTGTLTWSATGLPAGLSINPATGEISGTPDAGSAGVYTPVVTVSN